MTASTGKVYLIGAGPGAADLITVRGQRALRQADVIICDYLVPSSFFDALGLSVSSKTIIALAKDERESQEEINRSLYHAAKEGRVIARLKNGDPFIFGRGEEEAEYLAERGIACEIIPGLSACVAAPASAGLSLTQREHGRSFAVVTARCAGNMANESYPQADSLIIFMGVSILEDVVKRLLNNGWTRNTRATLIERATLPWERHVSGILGEIASIAKTNDIRPPALLVVGAAAENSSARSQPNILFTGLDPTHFRHMGRILHWPALQVVRNATAFTQIEDTVAKLKAKVFSRVIFTSKIGVRTFMECLEERNHDARLLSGTLIAAAGKGTAIRLKEYGLRADISPSEPGSTGILAGIGTVKNHNVLLVQGTHAPKSLEAALRERGAYVARLALHKVIPHGKLGQPLPPHDIVYFISPSGVRAYWHTYGKEVFCKEVWCIGEATRATLQELGVTGRVVIPSAMSNH